MEYEFEIIYSGGKKEPIEVWVNNKLAWSKEKNGRSRV